MRKFLLSITALAMLSVAPPTSAAIEDNPDIHAARSVFEQNIGAIRQRDRDRYLSYYLHDRRGSCAADPPASLPASTISRRQRALAGPTPIEATDIHLTSLAAGLVYGTYRYRVRYGAVEHSGISERMFVKTPDGWKIALTGAIDAPPGTPAPPRAITGATLIDGRGGAPSRMPPSSSATARSTAQELPRSARCPKASTSSIARGMWITPGLIDAHVHFSQTGWADGRPDALDVRATHPYEAVEADLDAHPERYGHSYLCTGVTSVFDVGGYPWTLRLHDRFENDTRVPHVVAAGPLCRRSITG